MCRKQPARVGLVRTFAGSQDRINGFLGKGNFGQATQRQALLLCHIWRDWVSAEIRSKNEALAVRLMHQHLLQVEENLSFERKLPSNDISMALS